jgi:hypothetical protein
MLQLLGPNERRCIIRESLGFYRALVVGGTYEFVRPVDTKSIVTYIYALRQCIDRYPQLSITIADALTESPYYNFCSHIDLRQHVQFFKRGEESEVKAIEQVLPGILDTPWSSLIPPWKIVVLPLSEKRCFIGFSYSHALGDGMSGIAFHKAFLNALQEHRLDEDFICTPIKKGLSPAFDTAENFPISWTFLLSPLLGAYLPERIGSLLGFHASVSPITPGTWTGSPIFYTPETYQTRVEILSIEATNVEDALKVCRLHGAKLTGFIHQLIIMALSESLNDLNMIDNFIAGTAINMRNSLGISNDEMGNFASGDIQSHMVQKSSLGTRSEFSWATAKMVTEKLAVASKQLHDQPIGLLRYLFNIRSWKLSKIGHRPDLSYSVSNIMSFQPAGPVEQCSVAEMVFCRCAEVTAPPLSFNVVSAKNGPMNISVSWQVGALNLGSDEDEVEFDVASHNSRSAGLSSVFKKDD